MRSVELVRHKDRLDALFLRVNVELLDAELTSHWSRYLCVLVSGFIEVSIREILTQFAAGQASPPVLKFVSGRVRELMNPKMVKILDVIGEFDPIRRDTIERLADGELAAAVNGVVDNRNRIAHGAEIGIGFTTIENWYKAVVRLIDLIESHFPPTGDKSNNGTQG